MNEASERIRVITDVSEEELAKIDELAERLNMSRSKFLANLISVALEDQDWLIRLVTSRFMEPFIKAVKNVTRGKRVKECGA